jgi:hypothetical protein
MPRITWRIEDANLTLVDGGGYVPVTLELPGQPSISIPPLTLGVWPFSYAGRALELRALRNLDRLRYQLWCEGHLLPRGGIEWRSPLGAKCETHTSEPAVCLCTRCRRAVCTSCSPNGFHCKSCLDILAEADRLAAIRQRRLGIGASIALMLAVLGAGVVLHAPAVIECGVGGVLLIAFLLVRGLWQEHRERKRGAPAAIDAAARR